MLIGFVIFVNDNRLDCDSFTLLSSTMRLRLAQHQLSTASSNSLLWNNHLIDELLNLPRKYKTGDDLNEYTTFWSTFGSLSFQSDCEFQKQSVVHVHDHNA